MKKLIKKHEMAILKGLLLITVIGSIVITIDQTRKSMNEFKEYQLKFEENLNKRFKKIIKKFKKVVDKQK